MGNRIITTEISREELKKIAKDIFGDMVKAVVDVEKEILAIDAELHSDLEAVLLEDGSLQKNLWGINLYPEVLGNDFIEFDSMINLRPSLGNKSRGVDNESMRKQIASIVLKRISK